MIIIRDLFNGKKTFGDFLASVEKISTSVLTSRLELLKSYKIIDFVPSVKDKKVKIYYLTDKGVDLFLPHLRPAEDAQWLSDCVLPEA